MLKTDLMRICKNTYYSDSQLDKGGAETSEGDAEENPAQVPTSKNPDLKIFYKYFSSQNVLKQESILPNENTHPDISDNFLLPRRKYRQIGMVEDQSLPDQAAVYEKSLKVSQFDNVGNNQHIILKRQKILQFLF